jgi:hypothetical protein
VARFQLDEIRGSVGDDWAEGFNLSRVPTDPYPTLISLATLFVRIGGGGLLAAPIWIITDTIALSHFLALRKKV